MMMYTSHCEQTFHLIQLDYNARGIKLPVALPIYRSVVYNPLHGANIDPYEGTPDLIKPKVEVIPDPVKDTKENQKKKVVVIDQLFNV